MTALILHGGAGARRERNYDAGCSLVRKLRFLDKIEAEIDDALEAMAEGAHGHAMVKGRS